MSTKTTIAGGALILAGGLGLAIYANNNVSGLQQSKAKTVLKYTRLSRKALNKGDVDTAETFARQALATDPKNEDALESFRNAVIELYKEEAEENCAEGSAVSGEAPKPKASTKPVVEMGC